MVELLIFLATKLDYLLEPGRFRIVGSESGRSQGGDALLELVSNTLRVRLTRDRGQILMSFQPLSSTNDWFSPGLLRGMLTGERATGELSALDHQVEFLTDRWAMALQKARTDPGAGAAMREIRRDYVNHRFGLQL